MVSFTPGRWPTLSFLAALAILLTLGVWQLQRLDWKTALIAEIDARTRQAPVLLPDRLDDAEAWRFRRVRLDGVFDHDRERHVFAAGEGGGGGWRLFTPLIRARGPAVLIDRGWVPDRLKAADARPETLLEGRQSLTGLVRLPQQKGVFTPANEPGANRWYFIDLKAMTAAAGGSIIPDYFIERDPAADAVAAPPWPRARHRALELANRHLEYALTWFSLAAVLTGVYVAWGLKREQ